MNLRLACLINGSVAGPAALRARDLVARLPPDSFSVTLHSAVGGRAASIRQFVKALAESRPDITYVMDNGLAGVIAAAWHKTRFGNRVVIDTGDEIVALVRSSGMRGPVGLALTWALERLSFKVADRFIVRGHLHKPLFDRRGIACAVVPDGVDTDRFKPQQSSAVRARLGTENQFTVGVVGSCVWSARLQMCYGWELIEAVHALRDLPVTGLIVGDGDGIAHLQAECRRLALADRILFLGRIPYAELADVIGSMDVCLSTQTNDVVGQVRTTGKLPIYLAAGRFVLASDVGEASRVLPSIMKVPYQGTRDPAYSGRLAARIRTLLANREPIDAARLQSPAIARREFDYLVLVPRLAAVLGEMDVAA